MPSHELELMPLELAVCRLAPEEPPPAWALESGFYCLMRTPEELSIICPQEAVPAGVRRVGGWRCLKVRGPLDFGQVGVLASLAQPLAAAGISILALASHDTDYILVPAAELEKALAALAQAGHAVR